MYKIKFITSFLFWWSLLLASCCTLYLFVSFRDIWVRSALMRMFAPSVVLSWTRVKHRYWWLLFSIHLFFAYLQSGLLQVCAKSVEDWWRCPSRFYLWDDCDSPTRSIVCFLLVCCCLVCMEDWLLYLLCFCVALSERVCARRAPRVVACFFLRCSAFSQLLLPLLVLRLFGYFILWNITCFFLLVLFIRRVRSRRQCYFQHRHLVWLPRLPPPTML